MKKISNLLMMALLTIGMGLTSCDEQLDNAVTPYTPGVTPEVDEKGEVTSITVDLSKIDEKYLDAGKTKLQLTVGDEVTLSFTILPEEMADTKVELTADDETILSIDGLKVKALKEGETKVTAKAGEKTAECTVTVALAVESVTMGSYKCAKVYTSATNGYYIMCTDHSTGGNWSTANGYSVDAGGSNFTIGSKEQWTAIMTACGGTGYSCINTKCSSVTGWSNMGTKYYWSSTSVSADIAWAIKANGWGGFDPDPQSPGSFHTRLISAF